MLHVKSGDKHLLILGPVSLEQLRAGQPVSCPDAEVEILYSPDVVWLASSIATASGAGILNDDLLGAMHEASMARTPVFSSPQDEHKEIIRGEMLHGD